tara:strand:- start:476 stop:808 length:333 start_codon:yes stop_codon:yes gene_type:complete
MINAKNEFLEHIKKDTRNSTIKCAKVTLYSEYKKFTSVLPVNYTVEEYLLFLETLNVDYDNSFGWQELFGIIWYDLDLTWSTRGEYDGSEWWNFCEVPEVLPELINKNLP